MQTRHRISHLRLRFHGDDTPSTHDGRLVSGLRADDVIVLVLHNVVSRIPWTDIGVAVNPVARNNILITNTIKTIVIY